MIKDKEMVIFNGLLENITLENGKPEKGMEMGFGSTKKETVTMEIGKTEKVKDMESFYLTIENIKASFQAL